MTTGTLILIVIVILLLGVLPTWPHSRSWGNGPAGVLMIVLVVLLVLMIMGRI